jgi:hypothetical protein
MADTSGPVLVYNRIDENRRNTVLLLPVFAVLLFPVAYGLTQLLVPFSFYGTHVTLGGAQARLDAAFALALAKPDGWSAVALQLSPGTIVAFDKLVGNFAHVEVDGTSGYIPRIAGADDVSAEQSHP